MDDRGPVAGRLRRPGWKDPRLVAGLLLIAVSVVGVSWLVATADATHPHYAARETLAPGTVITADHLVVTRVRVGTAQYLDAHADPPLGHVVTRTVGAGELLPASAVSSADEVASRPIAVTTTSPVAAGVDRGSVVDVWHTRVDEEGRPQSQLIAAGAVVDAVERAQGAFSAGAVQTVYVVIPTEEVASFLEATAADGDIAVVGWAGS